MLNNSREGRGAAACPSPLAAMVIWMGCIGKTFNEYLGAYIWTRYMRSCAAYVFMLRF